MISAHWRQYWDYYFSVEMIVTTHFSESIIITITAIITDQQITYYAHYAATVSNNSLQGRASTLITNHTMLQREHSPYNPNSSWKTKPTAKSHTQDQFYPY